MWLQTYGWKLPRSEWCVCHSVWVRVNVPTTHKAVYSELWIIKPTSELPRDVISQLKCHRSICYLLTCVEIQELVWMRSIDVWAVSKVQGFFNHKHPRNWHYTFNMGTTRMMFELVASSDLPTNYMAVMKVDSVLDCTHECMREATCEAIAFTTILLMCYLYQRCIEAEPSATANLELLIYNFKRGHGCNGTIISLPGPGKFTMSFLSFISEVTLKYFHLRCIYL